MDKLKILLISNYLPDGQQSMLHFANMLEGGLSRLGHDVKVVRPEPFFGRIVPSVATGLGKWLAYIDKFILFPYKLSRAARWADIIHVCDHSNSVYVSRLKNIPNVVTCHDVLAIRGGLGEQTDCPASLTGKILQRWILRGLDQARMVACDSSYTRNDLLRLLGYEESNRIRLIMLAPNYPYRVLTEEEVINRLKALPEIVVKKPYILHVGSNLRRKNREIILRTFARIKDKWDGQLVFAGAALTDELVKLANMLKVNDRVVQIVKPESFLLEALYNKAFVFFYPSRFEGGGFPILEAQACGCPVICSSDCGPFPEIVENSATMYPSGDEESFAKAILRLQDFSERNKWTKRGLENTKRFSVKAVISDYIKLYEELLEEK
jgi:glycosyltransferase involved in cell wall biosynthesis